MHFAALKGQNRCIGGWNWPQITRMKPIFADFSKGRSAFSTEIRVDIRRICVIRGELNRRHFQARFFGVFAPEAESLGLRVQSPFGAPSASP